MKKIYFFPKLDIKDISILGLLIALAIINGKLLNFSYPPGQSLIQISVSFIVAMVGILYGPVMGGAFGAIVDLLGVAMFGVQGIFHIGFTFSAFIGGFIPGLIVWLIVKYRIKFDFTYLSIAILSTIIPFSIYYTTKRASDGRLEQQFVPILTTLFIASTLLMIAMAITAKLKTKKDNYYPFDVIFAAVLPAKMLISFVLNPIWLSQLYGNEIVAYLPLRFITFPISTILSIIVLYLVLNRFGPMFNYNKIKK